jgi:hypothetical protein
MHSEGKSNIRSHNTRCCLIEVVTKAGLTIYIFIGTSHLKMAAIAAIMVAILAAIFNMVT